MTRLQDYDPVEADFLAHAPVRVVSQVRIRAAAELVFSVLEDGASWPVFVSAIRKVEWTSERPWGVGTTRTVHMRGGTVAEEVFFAWDPGRRMAFRITRSNLRLFRALAEDWAVAPNADGTSTLTWTFAAAPRGPYRLLFRVLRRPMQASMKGIVHTLRRLAEARAIGRRSEGTS